VVAPPPAATILPNADAVARAAAERLLAVAAGTGRAAICLSGGSTPRRLYALLAGSRSNSSA
jgi:6-phosphogluconolactonase